MAPWCPIDGELGPDGPCPPRAFTRCSGRVRIAAPAEDLMFTPLPADRRIERPGYAWIAIALEVFTAVGAIPVGIAMLTDTTGRSVGLPGGWIEASPFGSYLVPGLYLLAMNGIGML